MGIRESFTDWVTQPQDSPTPSEDWIDRGMVALFDCRQGRELILDVPATTDTLSRVASTQGVAPDFSGVAQVYPHRPQYGVTGPLSILVYCDVDALTNSGDLIGKGSGTFTTATPYGLKIGVSATDSRISLLRGGNPGIGSNNWYMTASAANTFSAPINAIPILVVDPTGLLQGTRINWANGTKSSATQVAGVARAEPVTDGGGPIYIGKRDTVYLDGRIYFIAVFNRALSDDEAQSLSSNPWQVYEPQRTIVPAVSYIAYTLNASQGTFSAAGQTQNLNVGRRANADSGAFSLAGQEEILRLARILTPLNGDFTTVGTDARLTPGSVNMLYVNYGTFGVSGQNANLSYGKAGVNPPGYYNVAGQGASVKVSRKMTASYGSYLTSGQPSTVIHRYKLSGNNGSYAVTGQTIGSAKFYSLSAGTGLFSIVGQPPILARGRILNTNGGTYTTNGFNATLDKQGRKLYAGTGNYSLAGRVAALNYSGAPNMANFAPVGGPGIYVQYTAN
jgi:hypothetical protein